jgi:ubiquinone/menaquinone biosynthesis C-methylase UbiE
MRIFTCLILALTFLFYPLSGSALQPAEKHEVPKTRFSDVEKWARVFEDPKRAEWQKPEEVVMKMNLNPGDTVVDIGAGTGYFTRLFARTVGPEGNATGLEIEESMVNYMKDDAKKLNLKNYKARLVRPDDPELPHQSVDVVFLCNTYHHIDNRVEYFKRLSRGLKQGGRVVIIDFYKRKLPVGPSPQHKISQSLVKKELEQAGYRLIRSHDILPHQYFLEFKI